MSDASIADTSVPDTQPSSLTDRSMHLPVETGSNCHEATPSLLNLQFDMDELMNCMRCGYCLNACPTYRHTKKESASPRGRIALMKGVADGLISIDSEFDHNMYLCLGCRACETACPSGVQYGKLLEDARNIIEENLPRSKKVRLARTVPMKLLFPYPKRMRLIGDLLWIYQKSGVQKVVRKSGLLKYFGPLGELEVALGDFVSPLKRRKRTKRMIAQTAPSTTKKLRVGLFTGCVMDAVFYQTNQATARVLAAAGCEVVFFEDQTCCGALHAHAGNKADAIELAKRNIVAFEKSNLDVMVNNAGGCGAALKEYHHWLEDDQEWSARAKAFVEANKDVNELLATIELPPLEPLNIRVTYQDSCHLRHGQKVFLQPRQLLQQIPGATYVELPEADRCCGSAGIYNITNQKMSMTILDEKMENVKTTYADVIVTSNPGCLLQMRLGIERAGLQDRMKAMHIIEVIDKALPKVDLIEFD